MDPTVKSLVRAFTHYEEEYGVRPSLHDLKIDSHLKILVLEGMLSAWMLVGWVDADGGEGEAKVYFLTDLGKAELGKLMEEDK